MTAAQNCGLGPHKVGCPRPRLDAATGNGHRSTDLHTTVDVVTRRAPYRTARSSLFADLPHARRQRSLARADRSGTGTVGRPGDRIRGVRAKRRHRYSADSRAATDRTAADPQRAPLQRPERIPPSAVFLAQRCDLRFVLQARSNALGVSVREKIRAAEAAVAEPMVRRQRGLCARPLRCAGWGGLS